MDSQIRQLHSRAESLATTVFQGNRAIGMFDEAVMLAREALELCPPNHYMRPLCLSWLAVHLSTRFNQLGALQDLEEAIVLDREALLHHPQGHLDRSMSLNNLAVRLSARYNQLGTLCDLEEAIALDREALSLRPQGHPHRPMSLNNLAVRLSTRYNQLGVLQDLEEAVALDREALSLYPQGHPDHSVSLNNLAVDLSTRYNQLGALRDLEEAIILGREAHSLCPQGHPDRSMYLNNLALCLSTRYNQLGTLQDLEEAIVLDREALSLRPQGHPDRSKSLNNLAVRLSIRYNQLGALRDLKEAIALDREALSLRPQGHPDRSMSLNNLADGLYTCYNQLGALQDLEEAIVLDREALSLYPQGHPDHSKSLNNLAVCLSARYNQLGALRDLEEAIILDREALSLRPQGHPDRSSSLNNLAVRLSTHYNLLGVLNDLEEAITLNQEALSLRPQAHPDRSKSLNNLALCLSTRYNQLGTLQDLEEAIIMDREALSLRPQGHPDRSKSLNNLAVRLSTRYNQLGALLDLKEAIVLNREALSLRLQGHPLRSSSLNNLANCFCTRCNPDPATAQSNQDELFFLYAQLGVVSHTVSLADLFVCREWISRAEHHRHLSTVSAYETSLRLLVEYLSLLPSLPQNLDILKKQTSSLAVDAFSACLRNGLPERAVELLEQGRGVFWSQLTRLHPPLDDVIASGHTGEILAGKFICFSSLIRKALDSPSVDQHEQLCHLNLEMRRVVSAIRDLPGLSRFLLFSLFADLRLAASGGPVIIVNASQFGCDALIVFEDYDLVHIPLSISKQYVRHQSSMFRDLTASTMSADKTKILGRILRELWDDVVSPIVDFLQTTYPLHSRIWWCPTAEFSTLPLHAAGPYRKGQPNLASLYISSYTPSLGALIRARRRPCSPTPSSYLTPLRFVGIGQADATGQSKLFGVSSELANIGDQVGIGAMFTRIEGDASRISRVTEELAMNKWVHFACHGLVNRKEPFRSAFALGDGDFTIERIIRCDLKDPEFAYLSACHTTVGDDESPDEMIHLASAMQFVGFRSVIGTMWAVDDGLTNKITSTFYPLMLDESGRLDHTRAAYALNETMKTLDLPLDQRAVYVHIGA